MCRLRLPYLAVSVVHLACRDAEIALIHYLTELVSSADRFQLRYHDNFQLAILALVMQEIGPSLNTNQISPPQGGER